MNNENLVQKIKRAAERDRAKRKDPRFQRVMAFLVKKGFLKTNMNFSLDYVGKIRVKDALWAGKNLEPRILEVLPAAMARLPRAFTDLNDAPAGILQIVEALRNQEAKGPNFAAIPYAKIKVWMDLALLDGRTKPSSQKRITKTFRFSQRTIDKIASMKLQTGSSETEIIENLISLA